MNVTPEMINALATLRSLVIEHGGELKSAVDTLDNGGVFNELDEATDWDIRPDVTSGRSRAT
jgi:hypothetical protein